MRVSSFAQNHYLSYFSSLCSRDMHLWCAICLLSQARYCFALRNSDIFAVGECGGKYALYKSLRRAVRGISLAVRQISQAVLISQIREDLYRFSLPAFADKLNFPRVPSPGTYPPVSRRRPHNPTSSALPYHVLMSLGYRKYKQFFSDLGKPRDGGAFRPSPLLAGQK